MYYTRIHKNQRGRTGLRPSKALSCVKECSLRSSNYSHTHARSRQRHTLAMFSASSGTFNNKFNSDAAILSAQATRSDSPTASMPTMRVISSSGKSQILMVGSSQVHLLSSSTQERRGTSSMQRSTVRAVSLAKLKWASNLRSSSMNSCQNPFRNYRLSEPKRWSIRQAKAEDKLSCGQSSPFSFSQSRQTRQRVNMLLSVSSAEIRLPATRKIYPRTSCQKLLSVSYRYTAPLNSRQWKRLIRACKRLSDPYSLVICGSLNLTAASNRQTAYSPYPAIKSASSVSRQTSSVTLSRTWSRLQSCLPCSCSSRTMVLFQTVSVIAAKRAGRPLFSSTSLQCSVPTATIVEQRPRQAFSTKDSHWQQERWSSLSYPPTRLHSCKRASWSVRLRRRSWRSRRVRLMHQRCQLRISRRQASFFDLIMTITSRQKSQSLKPPKNIIFFIIFQR